MADSFRIGDDHEIDVRAKADRLGDLLHVRRDGVGRDQLANIGDLGDRLGHSLRTQPVLLLQRVLPGTGERERNDHQHDGDHCQLKRHGLRHEPPAPRGWPHRASIPRRMSPTLTRRRHLCMYRPSRFDIGRTTFRNYRSICS
jgi:hypothetical protein